MTPHARAITEAGALALGTREYASLRWLPRGSLRELLDGELELVPTSRALCELWLAQGR